MIDDIHEEIEILERHIEILESILQNQPIGINRLSKSTGYEPHKVRYSLRILQESDFIDATAEGAITTERLEDKISLYNNRLRMNIAHLENMQCRI